MIIKLIDKVLGLVNKKYQANEVLISLLPEDEKRGFYNTQKFYIKLWDLKSANIKYYKYGDYDSSEHKIETKFLPLKLKIDLQLVLLKYKLQKKNYKNSRFLTLKHYYDERNKQW